MLSVGDSTPATGDNLLALFRGFASDFTIQELNSDDWLLIVNGLWSGSAWLQPDSGPSSMIFMHGGGQAISFYTSDDLVPNGWVFHMHIDGSEDGRVYIGADDSVSGGSPAWAHDGEGLSIDHEEDPNKAWFQGHGADQDEHTAAYFGTFLIADDAAERILAANIPDHGYCDLVGNDITQSALFYYDLASGTTGVHTGASMSLDGTAARTGTDGTDGSVNIGASSAGLDIENRAGGSVRFAVYIHGRG